MPKGGLGKTRRTQNRTTGGAYGTSRGPMSVITKDGRTPVGPTNDRGTRPIRPSTKAGVIKYDR